ncbi:CobW family GTP-binding protein [Haliangium ochraceum]|uniref:Cobalamin synthesis protein P47K n=1 Tax=Haliangium ochraceum (strain DSM 14365 / JCM 11303 / SMP-2) TaxID=502025 RepID=D0LFN7_HALO1|nr:GTP-binding protein [Haliangium ochraceum]ACY12671.1 cobalamin synthesis protein P47K [Haliangium ochraceum DSM 14365]
MSSPTPTPQVPVIVLTGFLGSGKTTLLNRLMRTRPLGRGKLAIVVNEFGEVGIDGELLPSDMTRQVELPGGCICCLLNDDLDTTLLEILDSNEALDAIIIETTGIAEPMPICWALEREPLSERVRLAAVITVVDAVNFETSRADNPSVDAQVEYADILVLSKLDELGISEPPAALVSALREENPNATLLAGTPEEVSASLWRSLADPEQSLRRAGEPSRAHEHEHEHGNGHGHSNGHEHGDRVAASAAAHGFDTLWLPIEATLDFEELASQLEELPGNWVRIKGIAHAADGSTGDSTPRWIAFHRVGTRVSWEPLAAASSPQPRIVALGRELDRSRLAACLDAAVLVSERSGGSRSPFRGTEEE